MPRTPSGLDDLEETLRKSIATWIRLQGKKGANELALREYHLGQAAGIMKAMNAFGQAMWCQQVLDSVQDDLDRKWRQTEGGKAWNAAEVWFGRQIFRAGR